MSVERKSKRALLHTLLQTLIIGCSSSYSHQSAWISHGMRIRVPHNIWHIIEIHLWIPQNSHRKNSSTKSDHYIIHDKMGNTIDRCIIKNKLIRLGTTSTNSRATSITSIINNDELTTYKWHLKLRYMSLSRLQRVRSRITTHFLDLRTLTFFAVCTLYYSRGRDRLSRPAAVH